MKESMTIPRTFPLTMTAILRPIAFVYLMITILTSVALGQHAIDTVEIKTIGGLKQYLTIKGNDSSKPLLLFLHGGPGGSVMGYANKFTDKLQQHFVVVQWDQRETGKTKDLNSSTERLSLRLFQQDTHDVVVELLKEFKRDKLYLAGHSWGTILGFHIAINNPELLYAYIPISPMIDQWTSEKIVLDKMKEKAKRNNNKLAEKELASIKVPFEKGEDLYYHRKWLFEYNGRPNKNFTKEFALQWTNTWLEVYKEAASVNLIKSTPVIQCPVFFCIGRKDLQTNYSLVNEYYELVKAPKKNIFWFERAAHSIPSSEPDLLQKIIIERILPETQQ